jgi:hypothetical protein
MLSVGRAILQIDSRSEGVTRFISTANKIQEAPLIAMLPIT